MKELLGALLFLTITITVFPQKASKITLGNFGEVTSLTKHFFEDLELNEGMASSYLAPGGSKPERRQGVSDLDYAYDVAVWESRYGPGKVNDGDSSTVWSEGVEGPGIGEVIVVGPVDTSKPMLIWSGHGKSKGLFYANNRPEEVEIYTIEAGDVLYGGATVEASVTYRDLSIYRKHTVTLQDYNGYQELPIRKPPASREGIYLIAVKIKSVYPGTKYDDTCISEITQE